MILSIHYRQINGLAKPPTYMSAGAAGLDLFAAIPEAIVLAPGERVVVPTGIALEIPTGYEAQVRPRSGWAAKHGVTVLNSPGTIDSDYRGEIVVILIHHGDQALSILPGDRVAQLIVTPVAHVQLELSPSLSPTGRGSSGMGSTGT